MVTPPGFVVIAGSGPLADDLATHYRRAGASVAVLPFDGGASEAAAGAINHPVDLLVVCDFFAAPDDVTRAGLSAAMRRLTYLPFRLAALLKPNLKRAGGHAVLVTDLAARMTAHDVPAPYLDRPFRAGAHALWRCLSVEWAPDGVTCGIVGIDPAEAPAPAIIAGTIAAAQPRQPCELVDINDRVVGW